MDLIATHDEPGWTPDWTLAMLSRFLDIRPRAKTYHHPTKDDILRAFVLTSAPADGYLKTSAPPRSPPPIYRRKPSLRLSVMAAVPAVRRLVPRSPRCVEVECLRSSTLVTRTATERDVVADEEPSTGRRDRASLAFNIALAVRRPAPRLSLDSEFTGVTSAAEKEAARQG